MQTHIYVYIYIVIFFFFFPYFIQIFGSNHTFIQYSTYCYASLLCPINIASLSCRFIANQRNGISLQDGVLAFAMKLKSMMRWTLGY